MDKQLEIDGKEELDSAQFVIQHYSENSHEKPPFLEDKDYYFDKTDLAPIPDRDLDAISDSEVQTKTTQEDMEKKQKESLNRSLEFLLVSSTTQASWPRSSPLFFFFSLETTGRDEQGAD